MHDFRNYVQYKRISYRMTYTQMIVNTKFVSPDTENVGGTRCMFY